MRSGVLGFYDIAQELACVRVAFGKVYELSFGIPLINILTQQLNLRSSLIGLIVVVQGQTNFAGIQRQQRSDRIHAQHVNEKFEKDRVKMFA